MKKIIVIMMLCLFSSAAILRADENSGESSPRIVMRLSGLKALGSPKDEWPNTVPLSSLSQYVYQKETIVKGSSAPTAEKDFTSLSYSSSFDALTPYLMKSVETQIPIKSIVIDVTSPGFKAQYKFEDVVVKSVQPSIYSDPTSGLVMSQSVTLEGKKLVFSISKGNMQSSVEINKAGSSAQ